MQDFGRRCFLAIRWGASHKPKLEEKKSYNLTYTEISRNLSIDICRFKDSSFSIRKQNKPTKQKVLCQF